MSAPHLPPQLSALLAMLAAAGGGAQFAVTPIAVPDGLSLDQVDDFLNEFIEQQRAKHREACPDCAAEHAAESAAAEKAAHEAAAKAKMAAEASSSVNGASAEIGTTPGVADRRPIGYMVFATKNGRMAPIPGSFNEDREAAQTKIDSLNALEPIKALLDMMSMLGQPATYEVRPVFGE